MNGHRTRFMVAALAAVLTVTLADVAVARTFVVPEVIEDNLPRGGFDTFFKFVYTGGLGGIPVTGTATARVELYLYDNATGNPLQGQTGVICNPCIFKLKQARRSVRRSVEDLANLRAGGLNGADTRESTFGYAIIVVSGADPDNVVIEASIVVKQVSSYAASTLELPVIKVPSP